MPPFSACVVCRKNKASIKCRREEGSDNCVRCTHLGDTCQVVPRKLGRKLGSKNRIRRVGGDRGPSPGRKRPPSTSTSAAGPLPELTTPLALRRPISPRPADPESPHFEDHELKCEESGARTPGGTTKTSPTFNMLSVLARVADDQPPEPAETAPRPPFDRAQFLDDFHEAARALDPNPYRGMSLLEEGLNELEKPVEAYTPQPGEEMVYARIDQPRFDLGEGYDPISSGVVREREARELVDMYWMGAKFRLLDPAIHTLELMRSRSAMLTAVVLLIGAQSLPVSGHTQALVARLEDHVEYLIAQTEKHCFQSLEICQALLIFLTSLGGRKLNRVWPLAAKATSIAIELRLDTWPPPKWATAPSPHHAPGTESERLDRNITRMIILLVDWECASAFFRSRRCRLPHFPQMREQRLLEWCAHPLALPYDAMAAAAMFLLRMFVRLQLEVAGLQHHGPVFDIAGHLASVDAQLQKWKETWWPLLPPSDKAMAESDMQGYRFILVTSLYEYNFMREWPKDVTSAGREACIAGALDIIPRSISILGGTHELIDTSHLFSYRYYRMAYTAFFTLRIISTSPRSGDHDMFLLSLIATLARRFIDLRLHENITGFTHVLGRRLMSSSRRLAAARINCGTPSQGMGLSAHPNNGDGHPAAAPPQNGQAATTAPAELPFELGGGLSTLVGGYGGDIFTLLDPSVLDSFYFEPADMGMSGLGDNVGSDLGSFPQ